MCTGIALPILTIALAFAPLALFAQANTLDFEGVVAKALQNSLDVKIPALDIEISKATLKETESLYYPTLDARWNSEYLKDLTGGQLRVTPAGTAVLVENTLYQNALLLGATYNLYDFGVRGKKVFIAEKDIGIKRAVRDQAIRDVKLRVLSLYTDALLAFKELASNRELIQLQKSLSIVKERLNAAGQVSTVEVASEVLRLVKLIDATDTLKLRMKTALEDLSVYTGERYDAERAQLLQFETSVGDIAAGFDPEKLPEAKIYALEIRKKEAELEILQRQRLPQIGLNSSYVLYGSDLNTFGNSLSDVRRTNFWVGLSATLPLFDGFKTSAQIEKVRLEIERLKMEWAKKSSELASRHAKLREAVQAFETGVGHQKEALGKVEEKLRMVERLTDQKIWEHAELLSQQIELLNQKWDLEKALINRASTALELKILSGVPH